MKNTKSFKELMEKMKERHPELKESLEEMERNITEEVAEELNSICSAIRENK